MAEKGFSMGLQAIPVITNNHHKVTHPIRNQYKKMKGELRGDDPDVQDSRTYEDKGYYLKRRGDVSSGEEIMETVRHRGEVKARRPGYKRRTSSMDNPGYTNRGYGGGYDSEGSVPPRSRVRAKSNGGQKKRGSSSSSSTSTSDLGSTTEEEKNIRKTQRKKWITAALASVATIHAASKVYSSIEAHDKRVIEVHEGTLSPEEAHRKTRQTRWQDGAAIAIAALGIKGAISEWNEVQEEHHHHKEMMEKKEEHHKKRLERLRRESAAQQGGYYKAANGKIYYNGSEPQDSERKQIEGPRDGGRKMIEGSSRSRGRSAYSESGRYGNGRSRSSYGRDDGYYQDDRRRSSKYSRNDNY